MSLRMADRFSLGVEQGLFQQLSAFIVACHPAMKGVFDLHRLVIRPEKHALQLIAMLIEFRTPDVMSARARGGLE